MIEETRWMSYSELAEALGITHKSAQRLVFRHKWARRPGNDKTMRVSVPLEYLLANERADKRADKGTVKRADKTPLLSPVHLQLARLEAELAGVRLLLDAERIRADTAEKDKEAWQAFANRPWYRRLVA